MDFEKWALPRLEKLLPLDEESLQQLLQYTLSLPKQEASDHLKNFLGDSPQAFEFIAAFNQRRPALASHSNSTAVATDTARPSNAGSGSEVPRLGAGRRAPQRKKKPGFNKLPPPRQIEDTGEGQHGYRKRDEEDYMAGGKGRKQQHQPLSNTLALTSEPEATQQPKAALPLLTDNLPHNEDASTKTSAKSKLPPSAAGSLISDSLQSKSSRNASPSRTQPSTKINLTGGASMRGATTTLNDLDSAIRTLEAQTNSSLPASATSAQALKARHCPCQAQRHALLAAAPNCINCGKIICAREGLGPCTFCGTALLSHAEVGEMLRSLKEERGRERMNEHNSQHKRADVAKAPRPFASGSSTPGTASGPATPRSGSPLPSSKPGANDEDAVLASARAHRDRLLAYQSQNARRTRIHDDAADFETPDAGRVHKNEHYSSSDSKRC